MRHFYSFMIRLYFAKSEVEFFSNRVSVTSWTRFDKKRFLASVKDNADL